MLTVKSLRSSSCLSNISKSSPQQWKGSRSANTKTAGLRDVLGCHVFSSSVLALLMYSRMNVSQDPNPASLQGFFFYFNCSAKLNPVEPPPSSAFTGTEVPAFLVILALHLWQVTNQKASNLNTRATGETHDLCLIAQEQDTHGWPLSYWYIPVWDLESTSQNS